MRELLTYLAQQVQGAQIRNNAEAHQPDYLLRLANGQFFNIFKMLN